MQIFKIVSLPLLFVLIFCASLIIIQPSYSDGASSQNQKKIEQLVQESYYEISAYVVTYFNEKCKLALQNCLFQTQWEKVFGKERLDNGKTKRDTNTSIVHHRARRIRRGELKMAQILNNDSYLFCQPYLVGRFCIDDYLNKLSNDYFQCFNGTNGNSPVLFKKSIYQDKCKSYYAYFFESHCSSINSVGLFCRRLFYFGVVNLIYFKMKPYF